MREEGVLEVLIPFKVMLCLTEFKICKEVSHLKYLLTGKGSKKQISDMLIMTSWYITNSLQNVSIKVKERLIFKNDNLY